MNAPRRLKVTSPFGWRIHPISKQRQFHRGVDIAIPEGTELKAPLDGHARTIIDAINGHAVVIEGLINGARWHVGYAHLVGPGKAGPVKAGEIVGFSGQTGSATGAHVHITVHCNGQYLDPLAVLDFSAFEVVSV